MKNVEVQQKSTELRHFQAKLPCNYAMIETGFQCFKALNTCFFLQLSRNFILYVF